MVYRANGCHFIVLQHVRGLKISKRENNINQFIAISENYWTRDQAGTKIMSVGFLCYFNKMYFYYMLDIFRLTILELMNYNHQSTFSTVQTDSKQFLYKGSQEARNTHSSKKSQLVPGTWSRAGQVPCQFNSYFLILISWTPSYTTKT